MTDKDAFRELRAELLAAGVYQHHEWRGWIRLFALLAGVVACLVGIVTLPTIWWLALIPLVATLITTAAMLGHEGIHASFSSSKVHNQLLAHVTFPLLTGLSALYWKHKHNGAHHGHPNVADLDPDVDVWPMAISSEQYEASGPFRRFLQRNLQGYLFFPLATQIPVVMRIPSVQHLIGRAKSRRGKDKFWWADTLCVAVHYTTWLVIPSILWGVLPTLAVYMAVWSIVGLELALIFAPAHIGMPITDGQHNDWLHQLETTRNLRVPRWGRWFFVGLDYQIEHHLFPRVPHQQLPVARDIVRAWCKRHELPHVEVGYGEAIKSVVATMRDAWKTPAAKPDDVRAQSRGAAAALAA